MIHKLRIIYRLAPSKIRINKGKSRRMKLLESEKSKTNFYNDFMNFKHMDIQDQLKKFDIKSQRR